MIEETIELKTADGVIDGFVYHSDDGGPRPGIIHYTDIFGIREANRGMAARLAEEGYTVLLPNVFYRSGRPPIMVRSASDEEKAKRFGELRSSLTPAAMDADSAVYVDYMSGLDYVADGPMGAIGYCFTGGMAMRTAAVRPEKIAAAASFHGGGLYTDEPSSPHSVLPSIKARLYFGHAFEDRSMPAPSIEKLDAALQKWGGSYESIVYKDAGHGWTVPGGPAYNRGPAEEAYAALTRVLRDAIPH